MNERICVCRGCLLGLAVGDAMGFPVDEKTWNEIQEDYGPNGLLGYDLVNGQAAASAYTQVAAYVSNGLLLGITRGKPENYLRYIHLSLREWARAQHFPRDPERSWCWVAKIPQMRVRKCKDSRMLDALRMETPATMERPINRAASTGSLPAAVAIGLACNDKGLPRNLAGELGAQTVALTHGNPETFLCGSVLAETVASIAENSDLPLKTHYQKAIDGMVIRYSARFAQAQPLAERLMAAIALSEQEGTDSRAQMENFRCDTAEQCLCAAMYATLVCGGDFDTAMILSVNHSGRSGAVGALTGGILGAVMGADALPEFYLECLESAKILEALASDLALGSPTFGLFDDDWDQKYVQGNPAGLHF